jgi:catechol 2,3-dioxygenase-like lactoylglutathione lyase family enzyme
MARIRHLAIVTSNRERLVRFYTAAFGMRVIYGREGATHLSDGAFNLAILDKRENLPEGLHVIGLDVEETGDLAGSLAKAGASPDLITMPKDHDAEYRALDPDGNRLDLSIHGWPIG